MTIDQMREAWDEFSKGCTKGGWVSFRAGYAAGMERAAAICQKASDDYWARREPEANAQRLSDAIRAEIKET